MPDRRSWASASRPGRASAQCRAHAITSPLLEASIDGARGVLLNIAGGAQFGLLEVNEAATAIHAAAPGDANIIFGSVIDDALGDAVRVTMIAAGFDHFDAHGEPKITGPGAHAPREVEVDLTTTVDVFAVGSDDDDLGDDDFDVPSFLK